MCTDFDRKSLVLFVFAVNFIGRNDSLESLRICYRLSQWCFALLSVWCHPLGHWCGKHQALENQMHSPEMRWTVGHTSHTHTQMSNELFSNWYFISSVCSFFFVVFTGKYIDLDYSIWLWRALTPLIITFLLPLVFVLLIYLSSCFLYIYKLHR